MNQSAELPVRWIESKGGPLILLPADLLDMWSGVPADANQSIAGDYARAVQVTDYIGQIDVGRGQALVLGGEPMPAALIVEAEGRLSIVRWLYADSDDAAREALLAVNGLPYRMEPLLFEHTASAAVLIDAADPGDDPADSLRVALRPGVYAVATAEYKPNDDTCFIVHRLESL